MQSSHMRRLARASKASLRRGEIRCRPEDFRVTEILGFEPSGEGSHQWLKVQKSNENTMHVARLLARFAGVQASDAGFSGLKDKRSVSEQWFSLPFREQADWCTWEHPQISIEGVWRHHKKLRRGTHRWNRFDLRVSLSGDEGNDLVQALERVRNHGVPNYFGEQRFGNRNLETADDLFSGRRLPRHSRSLALSAVRSFLFNSVLDLRVREGTWDQCLDGEFLNLDGSRSGFAWSSDDPEIDARLKCMDIHPTAPLYGRGRNPAGGQVEDLERSVLDRHPRWTSGLEAFGLKFERRPTRCAVRDIQWKFKPMENTLELGFRLDRGQFATSVLREVLDYREHGVGRQPAGLAQAADQIL